jgi:hypothetical protein
VAEIRRDIDAVGAIVDDLNQLAASCGNGRFTPQLLNDILTSPAHNSCTRHVALWLYGGKGTVFLQDANSLIMQTKDLVAALHYLRERVPGIRRITSYARSSTVARKTLAELEDIRAAGLDRIHIGLESGSDSVLAMVSKGTTAAHHIEAGRKAIAAGMTLSEYIMPGLGGVELSRVHADETARVLNAIRPHFIRLRSLRVPPHTPLARDVAAGRLRLLSDDETIREIRQLIDALDGIDSTFTSDHIMNLLEEVEGVLPAAKADMLAAIDRYLALPDEERVLFRLARRGGAVRTVDDIRHPGMRARLRKAARDLPAETGKDLETLITELGDQYI